MDIQIQARIMLGALSVFLFTVTILHQIFPGWNVFRNKYGREILGEQEGIAYEKRSSLSLSVLGLFTALAAVSSIYFQEKGLILFSAIGIFLSLFYQSCLNLKYFGTFSGPHMLHKKKFIWLRSLIYIIVLFTLETFLLPYEGMSLFTKCLMIALTAGAGAKFING